MKLYIDTTIKEAVALVASYVPMESAENMVVFVDATTFGAGKTGLIVTDRRFISFEKKAVTAVSIGDITRVDLTRDKPGALNHQIVVESAGSRIHRVLQITGEQLTELTEAIRPFAPAGSLPAPPPAPPASWELHVTRGAPGFTVSTTPTLEGRPIREYLGIVSAEAVMGVNVIGDILAAVTDVVGGRSGALETALCEGRVAVTRVLENVASKLGANAIVGIEFDYQLLGTPSKMVLVTVNGTAVRVADGA